MDHRDELETLVELARVSNMRRAAEGLGLSQSTLSECVSRLERRYGAPLFDRDRRGTRPTVYGQVVVAAAARALEMMDEAQREIGLIRGSAIGRLAIGAEPGLIEPYITEAIVRGLDRYPDLQYRLHALDSNTLVREVREKRVDFFLATRPDVPVGDLSLSEIGAVHGAPFVRRGHPLAGRKPLSLGEIMRFPIVQGPGPRWLVQRIAEQLRNEAGDEAVRRRAVVVVNDFGVVRALVRRTDAVGFATAALLDGEAEREAFVALDMPQESREVLRNPLLVGTLQERRLPPAALALIEEVGQVVTAFDRAPA